MRVTAIIVFMAVFVSGCGSSIIGKPLMNLPVNGTETEEIVFWHTYSDEETRVFENELLPIFHASHPDIIVKPVRVMHTKELRSSLIARATSLKPPDVVRMDIAWVPYFSNHGLLHPLSQMDGFSDVVKKLHPVALQTCYYDGEYYGLPLNMNTKTAVYNRELLKQLGIEHPPQSMNELIALAEKHNKPIGMAGTDPWASLPYVMALGGSFMNKGYTQAEGYLNHEATIQAVEKLYELHRRGILSPEMFSAQFDRWGGIQEGDMLMIDEGPWFYSILLSDSTKDYSVNETTLSVPFPSDHGAASILGGENLVILKGSRKEEAAWTFMKWMTEETFQLKMSDTGLLPTNKEAARTLQLEEGSYIRSYADSMDRLFVRPPVKEWERIENIYSDAMLSIFLNHQDIRSSLEQATREIDSLLME